MTTRTRPPITHTVKTYPEFFNQWVHRNKSFEIRKDDRDYQEGDTIIQHEYLPGSKEFTGRVGLGRVVYVLRGFSGLTRGFCAIECPFEKMVVRPSKHEDDINDLN
jgi:hypothetical protein